MVAVPVPDSGIPRETIDAARERVKDNRPAAKTGARFWELSGGIWRCASCGRAMSGIASVSKDRRRFYYRCPNHAANGPEACPNSKNLRAEKVEAEVWAEVYSWLKEPKRLRAGIERYIEQERRGDPEREMQIWAKRLAELDRKQDYLLDLATDTAMPVDRLRAKLDALETDRKPVARELEAVRSKTERLAALRLETEALIEAYSRKARAGFDLYTPQDRFDTYKALGLKVSAYPDGTKELTGVPLCSDLETQST